MIPEGLKNTCRRTFTSFVGNGPPYTATRFKPTYCVGCNLPIGAKEQKVLTEKGMMHEHHACEEALKMLSGAGIKPPRMTSVGQIENFLYKKIIELEETQANQTQTNKLLSLFDTASFLGRQINWRYIRPLKFLS